MREYELLYIVAGDKSEDETAKVTDAVNKSLLDLGGKVADENVWGRKRLAYPIAGQEFGWYVITRFTIDGAKVNQFDAALRLNNQVVRTVLVSADEIPSAEEAAKAEEATREGEEE